MNNNIPYIAIFIAYIIFREKIVDITNLFSRDSGALDSMLFDKFGIKINNQNPYEENGINAISKEKVVDFMLKFYNPLAKLAENKEVDELQKIAKEKGLYNGQIDGKIKGEFRRIYLGLIKKRIYGSKFPELAKIVASTKDSLTGAEEMATKGEAAIPDILINRMKNLVKNGESAAAIMEATVFYSNSHNFYNLVNE